ncbi:MAG TPA: hypothetical protein VF520_16275 [Thermoleophilaceae bacterium]|jgi:hypothetical protein
MSKRLATLALLLALAAPAGCGGGGDGFADEANKVCRDSEKEIRAASGSRTELVAAVDGLIRDLKAVDVPEDKRSEYDAWVATQERYFGELKAALAARDEKRIDALDDTTGDDKARELGLDSCTG